MFEVVCVDDEPRSAWVKRSLKVPLEKGKTYTVVEVLSAQESLARRVSVGGRWVIGDPARRFFVLAEVENPMGGGFCERRFRKVQKTDWQAWLSQSTDYDEEQQAPAPTAPARKREKA